MFGITISSVFVAIKMNDNAAIGHNDITDKINAHHSLLAKFSFLLRSFIGKFWSQPS